MKLEDRLPKTWVAMDAPGKNSESSPTEETPVRTLINRIHVVQPRASHPDAKKAIYWIYCELII
jgi:hypothetical protein